MEQTEGSACRAYSWAIRNALSIALVFHQFPTASMQYYGAFKLVRSHKRHGMLALCCPTVTLLAYQRRASDRQALWRTGLLSLDIRPTPNIHDIKLQETVALHVQSSLDVNTSFCVGGSYKHTEKISQGLQHRLQPETAGQCAYHPFSTFHLDCLRHHQPRYTSQ